MFGADHYVPVLKCKQGERQALGLLADPQKKKLTPLLEVEELPRDLDDETIITRSVEKHAEIALDGLFNGWGIAEPCFLDAAVLASLTTQAGQNGVAHFFSEAASVGLLFIPVVGLRRSPTEVAECLRHRTRGVCLRLTAEDLWNQQLGHQVPAFLQQWSLSPHEVDMVMDLGATWGQQLAAVSFNSAAFYNALLAVTNITNWGSSGESVGVSS